MVVTALEAARQAVLPADPRIVAVELERTFELLGVPENWDRVAAFYLEAFDDVPADLVALACRRRRRAPTRYFPLPGELRALIADELAERKRTLAKARLARARNRLPAPPPARASDEDKARVDDAVRRCVAALAAAPPRGARRPAPMPPAAAGNTAAAELAGFRLVDADDPRVVARLDAMGAGR